MCAPRKINPTKWVSALLSSRTAWGVSGVREGPRNRYPAFPLVSRESGRIPNLSAIAIPNVVFFPNPASVLKFWRIALPGRVAIKSRIPLTFPESRTVFWSNPALGNTLPDPVCRVTWEPVKTRWHIMEYADVSGNCLVRAMLSVSIFVFSWPCGKQVFYDLIFHARLRFMNRWSNPLWFVDVFSPGN